ncbi:hypothetical protein JMJ56_15015 [Belnapia sp. T18]|uniref:SPW repeat-containing protein n=1 Tax=Belnapia arida TaxID=2804533 RepID=A0ABS1U6K8_9PROT|nr:hypothetical protein [Belnapia arida]MBL6079327.1 hypothetical protein [Belnapia arida]
MKHFLSLRTLLLVDALSCAAMGAMLLAAPSALGGWMALPPALLTVAGLMLLPIAAFMAVLARGSAVPRWAVTVVVIGNVLWAAVSLLLPVMGMVSPNALGWVFLLGQAGFVALLAKLEADAASPAVPA